MSTASVSGAVHSARVVDPIISHSGLRGSTHLRFRVTGGLTVLILNANSQTAPDLHDQRETNIINHTMELTAIKLFNFLKLAVMNEFSSHLSRAMPFRDTLRICFHSVTSVDVMSLAKFQTLSNMRLSDHFHTFVYCLQTSTAVNLSTFDYNSLYSHHVCNC